MKKVLMGLAILPFLAGIAAAGQPLTDRQLDRVSAGFDAMALAEAEGLVGLGGQVITTTATLSQVQRIGVGTLGEVSSNLYKAISAASASTITSVHQPSSFLGGGAG
jgi:hypothetical protein